MSALSSIVAVHKVSPAEREAMFALHRRYFDNSTVERFTRDLSGKNLVIMLRDNDGIYGFSTLQLFTLETGSRGRVRFLFSGDTIIDKAHWKRSALAGCFGHVMLKTIAEAGGAEVYWLLISKGYRTYRFLPVFFNEFYPVYSAPTPEQFRQLLDVVASYKFGSLYDKDTGLIRFGGQRDRLCPELAGVDDGRLSDPHIRFFLERNPQYVIGDELACITPVKRENLNRAAWRAIRQTEVVWDL